jgi:hypothetical protein
VKSNPVNATPPTLPSSTPPISSSSSCSGTCESKETTLPDLQSLSLAENEKNHSSNKHDEGTPENSEEEQLKCFDCPICFELLFDPVTSPCGHSFCRQCLARAIDHNPACPVCRCALWWNSLSFFLFFCLISHFFTRFTHFAFILSLFFSTVTYSVCSCLNSILLLGLHSYSTLHSSRDQLIYSFSIWHKHYCRKHTSSDNWRSRRICWSWRRIYRYLCVRGLFRSYRSICMYAGKKGRILQFTNVSFLHFCAFASLFSYLIYFYKLSLICSFVF